MRDFIALAKLAAWTNNFVKMRRKILKNLKERKLVMTGLSPHFKILEKLRQTEVKEHIRRVKYQSWEEVVFSKATDDRSTGVSMEQIDKSYSNNEKDRY